MKKTINPGKEKRTIIMRDNICYSHVKNLKGEDLELKLSLMCPMLRGEQRLSPEKCDPPCNDKLPVVIWINGGGWRGVDKNMQAPDFVYLAEAGYAVACVYYRSSIGEGHFPDQVEDILTAVRFLRSHADKYGLDPDKIAVMGRSAGGHLASFAAMNLDRWISEEWNDVSSHVNACVDMFGPTDMCALYDYDAKHIGKDGYRWKTMEETHTAVFMGGDMTTLRERCYEASPINYINDKMCPILIMHGTEDPAIPYQISEEFYNAITAHGLDDRADFVLLENGGHGTREFSQNLTKHTVLEFLNKYLRNH